MNIDGVKMSKLKQRVAEASTKVRMIELPTGNREIRLTMRGIQVGSIVMLEAVLGWIDEIEREGDEHRRDASRPRDGCAGGGEGDGMDKSR